MKKVKEDPGIKLFGKKIVLTETTKKIDLPLISAAGEVAGEESSGGSDHNHGLVVKEKTCLEGEKVNREDEEKDQLKAKNSEGESSPTVTTESDNPPKTPPIEEETTEKPPKTETKGDATNSQPKTLKKPDKILPCPRCHSMDTKFCYYNNYNVNQPRHFCKSCQRYWTAGGTMRNMPVGAGRRKTKNTASECRFVTISQETFQTATAQIEAADPDRIHNFPPKVITFSGRKGEGNGDDYSGGGGSTVTTSNSVKLQGKDGFHSQVSCIPGVSWSYNPWNSGIGYPTMPIYPSPSPYWNCIPWLPNSLVLGKHSRDGELIKPNGSDEDQKKQKSSVLIPKTLRIDDPDEAAKSSIWATLGIKNENINRGLFKAFEAKGEEAKKHPVLQANPAALSRSLCFQERA